MSRARNIERKRTLEHAIKLNKRVIKISTKPHVKDTARFRIKLLKRKLEIIENRLLN